MELWDPPVSKAEAEKRQRDLERYEKPAAPDAYAVIPTPVSVEDRTWLETVDHQIWTETAPDRFGYKHRVESRDVLLTQEEVDRLFRLIRDHHLITTIGSGSFGFGYSMTVYAEPERIAGVEEKPEYLLCLTERHLPHPDGLLRWPAGTHGEQKTLAWAIFSQFVYSPTNLELLKRNGMDPPRRRSDLDY